MDKVYVFFEIYVDYYKVEIFYSVLFKKIKIIELKGCMKVFFCGLEMFFMWNDKMRMICILDFLVKYSLLGLLGGNLLFILVLFYFDKYVVIVGNDLLVVDKNNEELFKKNLWDCFLCGLVFDL